MRKLIVDRLRVDVSNDAQARQSHDICTSYRLTSLDNHYISSNSKE